MRAIDSHIKKIELLEAEIKIADQRIPKLNQDISKLSDDVETKKTNLNFLEDGISKLVENLRVLEVNIAALQKEKVDKLGSKIRDESVKKKLENTYTPQIEKLEQERDLAKKNIGSLNTQKSQIESDLQSIKLDLDKKKNHYDKALKSYQKEVELIKTNITTLQETNKKWKKLIEEKESANNNQKAEISQFDEIISKKDKEIITLKSKNTDDKKVPSTDKELILLNEENSEKDKNIKTLKEKLVSNTNDLGKNEKKVKDLEKKLENLKEQRNAQSKIAKKPENNPLKNKYEDLEDEKRLHEMLGVLNHSVHINPADKNKTEIKDFLGDSQAIALIREIENSYEHAMHHGVEKRYSGKMSECEKCKKNDHKNHKIKSMQKIHEFGGYYKRDNLPTKLESAKNILCVVKFDNGKIFSLFLKGPVSNTTGKTEGEASKHFFVEIAGKDKGVMAKSFFMEDNGNNESSFFFGIDNSFLYSPRKNLKIKTMAYDVQFSFSLDTVGTAKYSYEGKRPDLEYAKPDSDVKRISCVFYSLDIS
jgi:DNA repair exonuclease SbcCD ATPase subunit